MVNQTYLKVISVNKRCFTNHGITTTGIKAKYIALVIYLETNSEGYNLPTDVIFIFKGESRTSVTRLLG